MAFDSLFGGTPLLPIHFESGVALAVFNDTGQNKRVGSIESSIEGRLLGWIFQASPKSVMHWSKQIDLVIVPFLSPSAFRALCSHLCEHVPQALENMDNARESVVALARAVHLSKFINSGALDRIYAAIKAEGLAKD